MGKIAEAIIKAGREDTSIADISDQDENDCNQLSPTGYTESLTRFGASNVETALIAVASMVDPVSGLSICLSGDDEAVFDLITAAFSASRREELNSESWTEKVSEAIETTLYTFKMPVILIPDGSYRVTDPKGNIVFEGDAWGFVHWVREQETILIPNSAPNISPLIKPPFVPQDVRDKYDPRKESAKGS